MRHRCPRDQPAAAAAAAVTPSISGLGVSPKTLSLAGRKVKAGASSRLRRTRPPSLQACASADDQLHANTAATVTSRSSANPRAQEHRRQADEEEQHKRAQAHERPRPSSIARRANNHVTTAAPARTPPRARRRNRAVSRSGTPARAAARARPRSGRSPRCALRGPTRAAWSLAARPPGISRRCSTSQSRPAQRGRCRARS